MSIENKIDQLIEALNANTEALKAQGTAAPAPATRAPRGSKTAAAKEEPAETPAATPEPAKEEKPATPPAAKGPTANDLKKFVKDERTRLADVSGEAVKKHKEESAKILKSFGLVDFTSIPDDKVEAMLAAFKAVNVEQPKEDSLEDEDDDGL
jgi:hypothetical protein